MAEMIVRIVMFLLVLSVCGGIIVMLSRRGRLSFGNIVSEKDSIRIVSTRSLGGRKMLVAIEHMGTHFLLVVTPEDIKNLAEWPIGVSSKKDDV